MVGGREQEAEAGLVEQAARGRRVDVDLRAQLLEHVGRAASRADAAIAVLGDRQAARRRDEGRRGRDVDQPRPVAAGAAAIGEEIIGPVERQRRGRQGVRRADHFLGGLALHPQRDQHAGDLGRLELAEHEPLEQMLRVVARQILAGQQFGQGIGHRAEVDDGRGGGSARMAALAVNMGNSFPSGGSGGGHKKTRQWRALIGSVGGQFTSRAIAPPRKSDARHHDRAAVSSVVKAVARFMPQSSAPAAAAVKPSNAARRAVGPAEHPVDQPRAHRGEDRFGVELQPELALARMAHRHRHAVEHGMDVQAASGTSLSGVHKE